MPGGSLPASASPATPDRAVTGVGAPPLTIGPMRRRHWPDVRRIYAEGIATGHATLETDVPGWREWDRRFTPECRFVAEHQDTTVGWAALSRVSSRNVYRGVAEVSVYVATAARGRGVGYTLLGHLVEASEEHGFWTLQAGIFPENVASIRLHERRGFRAVGTRERIGRLGGMWRNVLLMERRSKRVGGDAE